jgi:hypothetical protein
MLQSVKSYDVFDTLIARNVKCPTDIFDIIENTYPYPNFKNYRTMAERKNGLTFDGIYEEFQKMTNDTNDTIKLLKEFEIQTEINNSYLIISNVNLVNDGDILISDMYLTSLQILRILRSLGFVKKVKIFSSSCGMSKSSGTLYKHLSKKYNIMLHTGDNEHSDCHMAGNNNIPYKLTNLHKFNDTELFFMNDEKYKFFGFLLRKFRLQNPYLENSLEFTLYNDQSIVNIPLLVLISFHLQSLLTTEKRDTLLFSTRDSCLLQPIFGKLFPDISTKTFQTSRIMNLSNNREYDQYLLNTYDDSKCIIFDGHGSFNSGRAKYIRLFNNIPRIHIFSLSSYNIKFYDNLSYNIKFGGNNFEAFNVDIIGTLIDLSNGEFVRDELDGYKLENAQIYKDTISKFCNMLQKDEIGNLHIFNNDNTVSQLIIDYYNAIYVKSKSNIIDNLQLYCNLTGTIKSRSIISNNNNIISNNNNIISNNNNIISNNIINYDKNLTMNMFRRRR